MWASPRSALLPICVIARCPAASIPPHLTGETVAILRAWLTERRGQPDEPLFPTRQGRSLSRYAVGAAISKYAAAAAANCPSLTAKRVTPHTLRHTNAMLLRAKGVDIATIALWLGHVANQGGDP